MSNKYKAISIGLIPNFRGENIWRCWQLLSGQIYSQLFPGVLMEELERRFGQGKVVLTDSGRVAIFLLLKAWGVGRGDEVIIQAFTCSVVAAAIKAVGAKVVFGDIDENYNLDLKDLEKKINKKTKVVIVQHTFGKPAKVEEIAKICRKYGIKLLEDLAHGLGNFYKEKKLGSFGNGAILSFGRDKVISGMGGGAVITDKETIEKINKITADWPLRGKSWVKKQLWYPIWMKLIINSYGLGIGKLLHWLLKMLGWVEGPISEGEKKGGVGKMYRGMPGELACLAIDQLNVMKKIISRRKEIAKIYATALGQEFDTECSYLRYSYEIERASDLRKLAAREGIFLGDWYDQVVAPKSIDPEIFGYKKGSCPRAERAAERIINLPTNYNLDNEDVNRVIKVVKEWK